MFRPTNQYALHRRLRLLLFLSVSISFVLIIITTHQNVPFSSTIIDRTILLIRTSHYCQSRLDYLRQSWIPTSLSQQSNIYFLTDQLSNYRNQTLLNSFRHLIETSCPQTHGQLDLCCKTAHEFELFTNLSQSNSKLQWMCRFDDDQYVNLDNLYRFLARIDASKPYYIGRAGANERLKVQKHNRTYQFATYGAGVCFSRPLLEKLRPYVNKAIFPSGCKQRGISDDAYVGYLTEFILNTSLTSLTEQFHSHLEQLSVSFRLFPMEYLQKTITLGFAWDRYTLPWLPVIHQLIQLANQGEEDAARRLWVFLQNYEKEHPEDLQKKYDQSCSSYQQKT